MKKSEIKVGGHYRAKVSGKLTTVRVDTIRERTGKYVVASKVIRDQTVFDVTNLATGRKTTFRSAAKFRSEVRHNKSVGATATEAVKPGDLVRVKKGKYLSEAEISELGPKAGFEDDNPRAGKVLGEDKEDSPESVHKDIEDGYRCQHGVNIPEPCTKCKRGVATALDDDGEWEGETNNGAIHDRLFQEKAEYRKTDCPACDGFGTLPSGGECKKCGRSGKVGGRGADVEDEQSRPPTSATTATAGVIRSTAARATAGKGTTGSGTTSKEGEQSPDPTPVRGAVKTLTSATATKPSSAAPNAAHQTKEGEDGSDPTASAPTATVLSPVSAHVGKTSALGSVLARSVDSSNRHAPHLIIEARAGTGKTTTLVEGLKVVKGLPTSITPSPQQQAIWDQLVLSKGCGSVCFVAFNKSIATELQRRVPAGCDAMTMHSMGFKAVQKALGRMEPNQYVVQDIIAELLGTDLRELRRAKLTVLKATEDLVGLCKQNLVSGSAEDLTRLASHYEVDLNNSRQEVFDLVPRVLGRCLAPKGKINFDDMIWLPVVLNLSVYRYDLLLVDEAQDLNRCQQALAKKAGRRLVLCGDPKQAIYGFAGADAESMKRMEEELSERESIRSGRCPSTQWRGCVTLPLTVTRRCGKAIIREAQRIVPDFEAHESNPEGKISHAAYPEQKTSGQLSGGVRESRPLRAGETDYQTLVLDGDFLLCRVNAPLVSQCFRFIKAGRKATIQGRDIGAGLVATVKKTKAVGVTELVAKLDDWYRQETAKEQAKTNPNEAKLIALTDRYDCLLCFTEGVSTVEQVTAKIESVFTDDKETPGIRLSSIHKAKGLESKRVFLLRPEGGECPHPMAKSAWQREQEWNLLYVAITRAIEELVYVS